MIRRKILNFRCEKQSRVCDVLVDNGKATLELKTSRNELLLVPWEDVNYQVDAAILEEAEEKRK